MTREEAFDWDALMSGDEARAYARGAEDSLHDALRLSYRDPHVLALVGIGHALLSVRSQLATLTGEVSDLTTALPAPRARRWRRLADRLRVRRPAASGQEPEQEELGEVAVPGPGDGRPRLSVIDGMEDV